VGARVDWARGWDVARRRDRLLECSFSLTFSGRGRRRRRAVRCVRACVLTGVCFDDTINTELKLSRMIKGTARRRRTWRSRIANA